jgi:hypothetical protein
MRCLNVLFWRLGFSVEIGFLEIIAKPMKFAPKKLRLRDLMDKIKGKQKHLH